jgi:hypothetical protein
MISPLSALLMSSEGGSLGVRVQVIGRWVYDLGLRVYDLGFRVHGLGFRV